MSDNNNELTVFDSNVTGLEGLDRSDIIIPRYNLLQNTSSNGTPGKFLSNLSNTEFDSIKTTFIAITKFRTMWPKEYNRSEGRLCFSPDGVKKVASGIGDERGCDQCKYAKWDGNTPPPCRLGYTFIGVSEDEDQTPFMISFKSSGVKPVKKFLSFIMMKNKPLFSFKVELEARKERNNKGSFFVPEFRITGTNTPEEMQNYVTILQGIRRVLAANPLMAEDAADTDTSEEGPTPSATPFNIVTEDKDVPF